MLGIIFYMHTQTKENILKCSLWLDLILVQVIFLLYIYFPPIVY